MHLANSYYGHNFVLARFAGLSEPRPILGELQHGFNIGAGISRDRWKHPLRKFLWSRRNVAAAAQLGIRRIALIGAPFLYLSALMGSPPEPKRATICYPFHTWEREGLSGDHSILAREIREREQGDVTVCLYWLDHDDPRIRGAYADVGFRVINHGHRNDPGFLLNQWRELVAHDRVVTNRVSSAMWYGAMLGRSIQVYGQAMGVDDSDAAEFDQLQRSEWPELFKDQITTDDTRTMAAEELGAEHMRDPTELTELLGWCGPRRLAATVAAPPMRGLMALKRRLEGW